MKKKIMSIMALAVLTVSAMLNINDVSAASTTIGDNQSSAQNLTVTKNVENVINNVTNTFTYSISADSNNPGNVTGLPSSLTVAFNDVAPGSSNVATQTATLDLSNVTFTVLGDYKFSIEETASSNPEIYPVDTEHNYTIYVSIRNELAANGKTPTGNLIATLVSQVKNNDTGAKTNILFKTSPLTSLTISNNVTAFVNHKEMATLTGLFINILPFIVLIALAVVGVYTIKKTAEKNA